MPPPNKLKLQELQTIISKMPLQGCFVLVIPEFGLSWREVSRAVRSSRLKMTTSNVARILCRHAASDLSAEEVDEVVTRLRLKLIATQDRKWHVIRLLDPMEQQLTVAHLMRALPGRVERALSQRRARARARSGQPEIQLLALGDLLYLSVQMMTGSREGPVLYVATPPGEPVALVSTLTSSLLNAVVSGLGYKTFEDAKLFGQHIPSLLRVQHPAERTLCLPQYAPAPAVTRAAVDFTSARYDDQYLDMVLGPDPPLLTDLQITSTRPFFDPSRLDKPVTLKIQLKSEDVAKTLRGWVRCGALAPTSDFFQIFHKIKSNKFDFEFDEE